MRDVGEGLTGGVAPRMGFTDLRIGAWAVQLLQVVNSTGFNPTGLRVLGLRGKGFGGKKR